ncbi:MBL fold metallo-hydrolase [Devosia sp.]|uniref:MBL fold metallo-hydrolase n=1 Tax=Devosia sp. TaxID=1871048 RepID=UPI002B001829|nr:MBL fold metallo-hydrolase [Devosia sp.]
MVRIGAIEIDWVEEVTVFDPPELFAQMSADKLARHRSWLEPDYYDAEKGFHVGVLSWIVRTPSRTIILDTGAGNGKTRPTSPRFGGLDTPYLARLAAKGIVPEAVDTVLLTHLHLDHVGWNTVMRDGAWVPTFANARHLVSGVEMELRDPERGAAARPPASWQVYNDSVRPVLEAGLIDLVAGDEDLGEGLTLMRLPGHSAGQIGLRVESEGQVAMFIADVVHQPIQVYFPHWNSRYCEDQDTARETRAGIFARAAKENALLLPAHFGGDHGGYIERAGEGYSFRPLHSEGAEA